MLADPRPALPCCQCLASSFVCLTLIPRSHPAGTPFTCLGSTKMAVGGAWTIGYERGANGKSNCHARHSSKLIKVVAHALE